MVAVFEQGDLIAVDFNPSLGHEPAKFRPAVVLSCDKFNRMSSLTVVCPVTSTDNGYPLHRFVEDEDGSDAQGYACVEALRAVDLSQRSCKKLGRISEDDLEKLLSITAAVFDV